MRICCARREFSLPRKGAPSVHFSQIALKPWSETGRHSIRLGEGRWPDFDKALTYDGRLLAHETNSMSDKFFVDTNILVYAHDKAAGAKHTRAKALVEELWRERTGVVSTQVLQELCVNVRRKAGRPVDLNTAREIVADYLAWEVVTNTGQSILEALELEQRYRISFWDALVVQAAQSSGAAVLYSEDLSDGQTYGGVLVVNPLNVAT
jgi:predicted nucleic acid-binding protein